LLPHSSSFPFQASLNHLFNNGNTTLLKLCNLILGMVAFLVHINLPFILAQMWHISNCFHLSCMFVKRVNKSWRNVDPHSKDHLWIHFVSVLKIDWTLIFSVWLCPLQCASCSIDYLCTLWVCFEGFYYVLGEHHGFNKECEVLKN
jgi:uncharacterized membrane protein YccF (DUF307 family)